MQHYRSNNESISIPIKIFSNKEKAESLLRDNHLKLATFQGLKQAYHRLMNDWVKRNSEDPDISKSFEKENERLIEVLELTPMLEEHGILIEDDLPNYYLVEVDYCD